MASEGVQLAWLRANLKEAGVPADHAPTPFANALDFLSGQSPPIVSVSGTWEDSMKSINEITNSWKWTGLEIPPQFGEIRLSGTSASLDRDIM